MNRLVEAVTELLRLYDLNEITAHDDANPMQITDAFDELREAHQEEMDNG